MSSVLQVIRVNFSNLFELVFRSSHEAFQVLRTWVVAIFTQRWVVHNISRYVRCYIWEGIISYFRVVAQV